MNYTDYLNQMRINATTGDNTSMRPSLEATRAAQLSALESSYNQGLSTLAANETKIPTQYTPLRSQAAVNAEAQRRAIQEQIANTGLSGIGQTSQTWQQRNANNANNLIGSYNLAQQQAINDIGLQRTNLGTQYNADVMGINTGIDRQIAEFEYNQREQEYSRREQEKNNLSDMFSRKIINYDQYRKMYQQLTGVDLGAQKSGKSKKTSSANEYQYYLNLGFDSTTASTLSGYAPKTVSNQKSTANYQGSIAGMPSDLRKYLR